MPKIKTGISPENFEKPEITPVAGRALPVTGVSDSGSGL
jgi:hypothetical protein